MFYLLITEAVIESQEHFGNQSVLVAFEMTCVWVRWHAPRGFLLACMNLETLVRRSLSVVDEPPTLGGKVSLPPLSQLDGPLTSVLPLPGAQLKPKINVGHTGLHL